MAGVSLDAGVSQPIAQGASLIKLLDPIASELSAVEELLAEQAKEFELGVQGHVRYVLGASGKRLRPGLALLAGGATGKITDGHRALGVIVELIHVATLIHDDVLDEAALRHGLPTSNARYGNEVSVLLGDCLFAHALRLAASFPTTDVCRKVSEATNTVCSGEILQNQRRFDLKLSLDQYLQIIQMKTGALFAVSCELGAQLNGASAAVVKRLGDFGANLGIAYQIYDDCVDIFGQERRAGKSLGTDVKKGKLTLPYILLLQNGASARREEIGEMIFGGQPTQSAELRTLVMQNGIIEKSLETIQQYLIRAEANLADLSPSTHSSTLNLLARYLSEQSCLLLKEAITA